jgi:hypothetical protein
MTDEHGHAAGDNSEHRPGTTPNPVPETDLPPWITQADEIWQAMKTGGIPTVENAVAALMLVTVGYPEPLTKYQAAYLLKADTPPSRRYETGKP